MVSSSSARWLRTEKLPELEGYLTNLSAEDGRHLQSVDYLINITRDNHETAQHTRAPAHLIHSWLLKEFQTKFGSLSSSSRLWTTPIAIYYPHLWTTRHGSRPCSAYGLCSLRKSYPSLLKRNVTERLRRVTRRGFLSLYSDILLGHPFYVQNLASDRRRVSLQRC